MQYLTIWDLLLTPVYLLVLTAIAKKQRDKRYPKGHPLRPYFLKGLWLKMGGAIFIGLVYQFYYGGGDTYNFFHHSRLINSALNQSFTTWFKLILRYPVAENPELYSYAAYMEWYNDPASYAVAAIAALIGLLNGTSYIPIALCFAYLSYTGIWAMYRTFVNIYPKLHKELAIAFLFIPSTFVWGSAIFKDTICMFGLGWLTYSVFRLFVNKDFSFKNLFFLFLSFYLVYRIKIYILMAFLPALAIWVLTTYSSRIKSAGVRTVVKIAFIGLTGVAFFFGTKLFAEELERYSLENIADTAATTRGWLTHMSQVDQGSSYDLGEFDPSIFGMIKKFPQAVVVTLFRPFPWEARKVIVLLSAAEALLFAFFTFKAFRKRGVIKTLQWVAKDANLLFFIFFSLVFAFAVGISSYNFGALSRYKIPCLPFYAAFIMVLLYNDKKPKQVVAKSKLPYANKRRPTPFALPTDQQKPAGS